MTMEIWLGDHYSHFDHGVLHMDDGSTTPLKGWIHTSTYGDDTLLVDDAECCVCGDFPLRWYIGYDSLHLYCWDREIERLILHNAATKILDIGRYGVLYPGDTLDLTQV